MSMIGTELTLERAHVHGFELVKQHTARFAEYVAALDDEAVGRRVPGSEWTVGETVAHVQSLYLRYTTDRQRSDSPAGVTAQNAQDLARLGVDVHAAADSISEQVALLEPLVAQVAPDRLFPFHLGLSTTMAGGWGNLLGELLAHGDDIGRATGSAFAIPSPDMEVLWRFTAPLLQGWLRAEVAGVHEVWRLRFPFGVIDAVLDRGRLRWGEPSSVDPDHALDVDDAAEFALCFPYRRRVITDPTTALLAVRFHDL